MKQSKVRIELPRAGVCFLVLIAFLGGAGRAEAQSKHYEKVIPRNLAGDTADPTAFGITAVTSGAPVSFSLPPTNFQIVVNNFYSIDVPAHTSKLEVKLATQTAGADLDLYVQFGQDVSVVSNQVSAEQLSELPTGNESITILADSTEGLRAGKYFIAVGMFTFGQTISGTITATATTLNTLVAPQFVNGGGWSTALFLTNLSTTAEGVEVRFYNDAGQQKGVPIVGLGLSSSIRRVLNPGETVSYETDDSGVLDQGWASIVPDTPVAGRISGFAIFRQKTSTGTFEAVVPLTSVSDRAFVMLFDDNLNGFQSGLALANPNATAIDISITIRDQSGQIIGIGAIPLQAFSHRAFFLSQDYVGLTRGSISFTSDPPIAALGLRFSPTGAFTSFPYLLNANTK